MKRKTPRKRASYKLDYTSDGLARSIASCRKCTRLTDHCRRIANEKKLAYRDQEYWGKPVPNFGASPSTLLVVGLAPAAHGANRTSRMFTGDRSGLWLYRALHKAGFARTSGYEQSNDNELIDCAITSVAHCAPPDNKPTPSEIKSCRPFLESTLRLHEPRAILCLGGLAWKETIGVLHSLGYRESKATPFSHGAKVRFFKSTDAPNATDSESSIVVFGSYHPSQQNTFTKRLTEPMFDSVFCDIRKLIPSRT